MTDHKETYRRLAIAFALIVIYLSAVWVRTESFRSRGHRHDAPFWVESAQHFRNVRMVAEGGTIPQVDVDLEYPGGLRTRSHTIHGEYALGLLARHLPLESIGRFAKTHAIGGVYLDNILVPFWPVREPTLSAFVRYFVRLSIATLVFTVYLISREISGSRAGSLLASILFAFSFGSISRSLGDTFYHEHISLPLLGIHIWFLVRAIAKKNWYDPVLCALLLIAALLTWKVIEFYFLVLILYFFLMFIGPGLDERMWRILALVTGSIFVVSLFGNVHLHYNRFFFSRGMLAAYSILIAGILQKKWGTKWKWSAAGIVVLLLLVKAAILDSGGRYDHVWLTFFYRLRYFDKPTNPSLLPFDVRHYWVPPYVSPNLFAFLNEVFWPVALALPAALGFIGYLLLPAPWREGTWNERRRQQAWLLVGFLCFLAFYLLFYKIKTFLILFSLPWFAIWWSERKQYTLSPSVLLAVGFCLIVLCAIFISYIDPLVGGLIAFLALVGWTASAKYRRRIPFQAAIVTLVSFAVLSQGYQTIAWSDSNLARGMYKVGIRPSGEKETGKVVPGFLIQETIDWIGDNTPQESSFLAEFVLSPSILEYARRPINQHCFFESDMRVKYEEFAHVLFGPEEEFYDFCRRYETDYFVYNAHMLLRDDTNMSFRYITAHMDWDEDWVAWKMHFAPEHLRYFEIVYQNPFIRIYRTLDPGEESRGMNQNEPYSPLFDLTVFRNYIRESEGGIEEIPDFLYPVVKAYELDRRADLLLDSPQQQARQMGLRMITEAVGTCPWAVPISNRLGMICLSRQRPDLALVAFENTLKWRPDDPLAREQVRKLGERKNGD